MQTKRMLIPLLFLIGAFANAGLVDSHQLSNDISELRSKVELLTEEMFKQRDLPQQDLPEAREVRDLEESEIRWRDEEQTRN